MRKYKTELFIYNNSNYYEKKHFTVFFAKRWLKRKLRQNGADSISVFYYDIKVYIKVDNKYVMTDHVSNND